MSRRTHYTANGLTILTSSHPRMRELRRRGHVATIHGHKLWKSSFVLMRHLMRHPPPRGARVLEIGCGWGLLGQFCARRFGARVHGIDADADVLPYLELHAEVNGVRMTAEQKRFEQLRVRDLEQYDLVLGADICFWDELAGVLFNLVRRARKAGVERVMIADPGRAPFQVLARRSQRLLDGASVETLEIARPVKAWGQILQA